MFVGKEPIRRKSIDDLYQRDAPQAKKCSLTHRTGSGARLQPLSCADKTRRLRYELYVINMKSKKTGQFDQYE